MTSAVATSGRASAAFTSAAVAARTTTGRPSGCACAERVVVDRVEHEGVAELELAVERDLRDPPAGRSEPALSHSSTVSPGPMFSTTALVSAASSAGVPVSSGNVPQ